MSENEMVSYAKVEGVVEKVIEKEVEVLSEGEEVLKESDTSGIRENVCISCEG